MPNPTDKNTDAELVRFVRTHGAKMALALSKADNEELALELLKLLGDVGTMHTKVRAELERRKRGN